MLCASRNRRRGSLLDQLEPRRMFAGTHTLTNGTLVVYGDNGMDNIVITLNGPSVTWEIVDENPPMTLSGVSSIYVYGQNGSDTISVTGQGSYSIINLQGGSGNDFLSGSDYRDYLAGGGGNDTIYGNGGNDDVGGDMGDDYVFGGAGNDAVNGHDGNDTVKGHTGNDTVYGENGHDWIEGGDGNDKLYGADGTDTLQGGSGADFLEGGYDGQSDRVADNVFNDYNIWTGVSDGDLDTIKVEVGYQRGYWTDVLSYDSSLDYIMLDG